MKRDTSFSAREVPWMKIGKITSQPVTAAEAAQLGGINFVVGTRPVYMKTGDDDYVVISGRKAVVREDTGEWLSVVGADYPLVQYGEAFDFMDAVSPRFVAAGSLRGGRQAFMVIETSEFTVADDPHRLYAVLRTSHDCSRAVEVMVMPLRGRCMNQLTLRSFGAGVSHRWSVSHTGNVAAKLAEAHDALKRLDRYEHSYRNTVERLIDMKVDDVESRTTLERVLPNRPRRPEVINTIINMRRERDTVGFSGTAWGLVNAVSEYYEWERVGGSSESRFLAALQGSTHRAINVTAGALLASH